MALVFAEKAACQNFVNHKVVRKDSPITKHFGACHLNGGYAHNV